MSANFTLPHVKTPISERLAGEFGRDWYRFMARVFASRSEGYRLVDSGTAVLVAGTITVSNRNIQSTDIVHLTRQVTGGTVGHLSKGAVVAKTSFVIDSSSATDTSTIGWSILSAIS